MIAFTDNLDVIDDELLIVRCSLYMIPKEEGGRHTPVTSDVAYRPNHNFGDENNFNFHIGQFDIPEGDKVFPGETKELAVRFLNVRGLREKLPIGKEWRIQEGATLTGIAKVLSIET